MITISKINSNEVKYLCNDVYMSMKAKYRINLNKWCSKHVAPVLQKVLNKSISDKPFLDIMLLSYDEIEKLIEDSTITNLDYQYSIKSNKKIKRNKSLSIKDYLIGNVYKAISKPARRKKILSITNLSVCPYCNRNFMNSSDNKNTCELDHFWYKSEFPIFAASFYNLIPSCPSCNRNKGTKIFHLSPYNHKVSTDNRITFSWMPKNGDFLYNHQSIVIRAKTHDSFSHDYALLDLNELYQIHSDLVQDVLLKQIFIPEFYLNEICSILSLSKNDIDRLYTGVYTTEKDYNKRPLSKLISDIYSELGYFER